MLYAVVDLTENSDEDGHRRWYPTLFGPAGLLTDEGRYPSLPQAVKELRLGSSQNSFELAESQSALVSYRARK